MELSRPIRLSAAFAVIAAVLSAWMQIASAGDLELPERAPRPEVHASPAGNVPVRIGDTPVPEARPLQTGDEAPVPTENPREEGHPASSETVTPPDGPMPEPSPGRAATNGDERQIEADPRSAIEPAIMMPSAEIACRQRLQGAGVAFAEAPPQSREDGCSLPYPISIESLGGSIGLSPPAIMNCAMAETMAKFAASEMQSAAQAEYSQPITALDQASAFVCRPRHGTAKLSEHAFGNALDIARFSLKDGTSVEVRLDPDEKAARFLAVVRKAACGPFKTVLGPGSDADHATHLHFDLQPRRNGSTFCQ